MKQAGEKKQWIRAAAAILAALLLPWQPLLAYAGELSPGMLQTEVVPESIQERAAQAKLLEAGEETGQGYLEQFVQIKASVAGASGNQNGYLPQKCLISTNNKTSTDGSDRQAAYVEGQTASGAGNPLGGTRVGYISFGLDPAMLAEDVASATVKMTVEGVHSNIGSNQTKAGLFQVETEPSQADPADALTYPAKGGDYSYGATVYSNEMFGTADKDKEITFDVTDMVRESCESKSGHVSFRLQTVISGFTIWAAGDQAPALTIEKAVVAGASGTQEDAGALHISTSQSASGKGSGAQAAFIPGETATGTVDATGIPSDEDRAAYLRFTWEEGLFAEEVSRAAVHIHVAKTEDGIGAYQTKAALFETDDAITAVDPLDAATYPAKDNSYARESAIYSNEWIGSSDIGEKTFDVTKSVKDAIAAGKHSASFRLQTVISGFSVSVSPDSRPALEIINAAEQRSLETSYDLLESMYQLTDPVTGMAIVYENGLKGKQNPAADDRSLVGVIRYGDLDMEDSLDHVPVALQAAADGGYFALKKEDVAGAEVRTTAQITDDRSQQFVLQKAENWTKEHPSYRIYHPLSRMYLGFGEGEPCRLQACEASVACAFGFAGKRYTALGRVRALPGYALLTEDEQKRAIDLLGGIGPYSICQYGGTGNTRQSFGYRGTAKLQELYGSGASGSAEEQAEKIRAALKDRAFSGQTNWYGLPQLPGADSVELEIKNETYGKYDFWRGTMLNGTKYELVITDAIATQTINLHIQDQSTAIANGRNAMTALKQIPYPLRKNIRNMYIRNDGANSYNCGANDFYMRVSFNASVNTIAMYMTHEFGHSMDFVYSVSSSGRWGAARKKDLAGVSEYGNNNDNEDLADFGRLYFQCYGKTNMMYALRQMFPNRYKEYVDTLKKTGYRDILLEKTEQAEQGASKSVLKTLLSGAEAKMQKADFYTVESLRALGQEIAQAQALVASPEAVQEDVDASAERLALAIDGLKVIGKKIAYFSFDTEETGFSYGASQAKNKGTPTLDAEAKKGKALRLNGKGDNYLTVARADGTPLLSDCEELTISFWSKAGDEKTNWAFYGAPDDKAQVYQRESYLGILDKGTKVITERYKNTGSRPETPEAGTDNGAWKFITVVIQKDRTELFINGEQKAKKSSSALLTDILGDNSILYIGRANWGTGEYFNGLLDEFSIYSYPMTASQVAALYQTGTEPGEDEIAEDQEDREKAEAAAEAIARIGTVYYAKSVKEKIDVARTAYDALSNVQKLLAESAYPALLEAEEAYAAAKEAFDQRSRRRIAHFTFDDTETGFESEYAKAKNKGTAVFSEDAKLGKALSLDGKNSNYLTVTAKDGEPLLTAYDEITVSYWGKIPQNGSGNWSFFAAGHNRMVQNGYETYAAVIDKGTDIEVQRFKNAGKRPVTLSQSLAADTWRYITVVIGESKTELYIDGEQKAEQASEYLLPDILGDNSICYIGRANWGTGEYFKGLLDEYSIYNYALSGEEIQSVYEEEKRRAQEENDKAAAEEAEGKISEIGKVALTDESKARIDTARAAYDALTEEQKKLVGNLGVLTAAEEEYKRLKEEAEKPQEPTQEEKDKAAAEEAEGKISEIGKVALTDESKSRIDAARAAYDALTEGQKKLVGNLGVLTAAEAAYAKLEQDAKEPDHPGKPGEDKNPGGSQASDDNQNSGGSQPPDDSQNSGGSKQPDPDQGLTVPTEKMLATQNPGLPKGNSEESSKAEFGALAARVVKSTKNANTLRWKKVKGAQGYVVFGNRCNKGGKKYKYNVLKVIKKNSVTSYVHKKLKKGTYYKYIVQAYRMEDGKLQILSTSKTIHASTTGGKYGNVGSLKVSKTKITLKKGKKTTIRATEASKYKKPEKHRKTAYESSNPKVASVNRKGVVKAKKKGSCYIYVYAQNGVYKRIKVSVKE